MTALWVWTMNSLDHKISVIKYHYHVFYVIHWLLDQTSVRELPIYKTPHLSLYWIYYSSMQQFNAESQETVLLLLFVSWGIYIEESVIGSMGIFLLNLKSQGSFFFYQTFCLKSFQQLHLDNNIRSMHRVFVCMILRLKVKGFFF